MKGRRGNPGLKGRLVDKSVEAYILALETINRLSIQYRIETFCYLFCNSWELLLKAKIIDHDGTPNSIYYKTTRGQPKRSLSLRDCLKRIIPNQKDPARRNIERIEELRDEATHLVLGHLPREVIGLFQAGVINYHKRLNEWFGVSLADKIPLGMMSIVYDIGPEQFDINDHRLRRKLGKDAAEFLGHYCAEVTQELGQLQRSDQFAIGIEYKLTLTKKPNDADIQLSTGPQGEHSRIIEVPRDPSSSHPFREKEVVESAKAAGLRVNQHDIRCVNKVYNIKKRNEYFYQGKVKGSPGQYSQGFVDWLIERYRGDDQFFQNTRAKAKMGS